MINKTVLDFLKDKELQKKFDDFWIEDVFLFWSYAKWEDDGVLDFLIDYNSQKRKLTLLEFGDLKKFIINRTSVKKVYFSTKRGISKRLLSAIEDELIRIK